MKTQPFAEVRDDYTESLEETIEAAVSLMLITRTCLRIVDQGGDPKDALDELREPAERLRKAMHG